MNLFNLFIWKYICWNQIGRTGRRLQQPDIAAINIIHLYYCLVNSFNFFILQLVHDNPCITSCIGIIVIWVMMRPCRWYCCCDVSTFWLTSVLLTLLPLLMLLIRCSYRSKHLETFRNSSLQLFLILFYLLKRFKVSLLTLEQPCFLSVELRVFDVLIYLNVKEFIQVISINPLITLFLRALNLIFDE